MCDVNKLAEELLEEVKRLREEMEAVVRAGERRASYLMGSADALQAVAVKLKGEEEPESPPEDSESPG